MSELVKIAIGNKIVEMTREQAQLPPLPTAEERLATTRAKVSLPRGQFALIANQQGWITEAEALAWAGGTAIPAWVEAVIDAQVPAEDRLDTKIKVLTDLTVKRTGNLMPMLQAEKGVSDNDLDVIFGIAEPVSPLTP